LINNVLAKHEDNTLEEDLENVRFSVLVDETTNINSNKLLCILVTYVLPTSGKILTKQLELAHVDARDCSSEALFTEFHNVLKRKNLQLENILGVSSDSANVMQIAELSKLPIDEIWKRLSKFKDFTGKLKFSNIYQLDVTVLSLPHSNAEVERIFS
ncbi:hypothetical protein BDFB_008658, partial [Asbolus verrucosus]